MNPERSLSKSLKADSATCYTGDVKAVNTYLGELLEVGKDHHEASLVQALVASPRGSLKRPAALLILGYDFLELVLQNLDMLLVPLVK